MQHATALAGQGMQTQDAEAMVPGAVRGPGTVLTLPIKP
jgi:hypothetical protein